MANLTQLLSKAESIGVVGSPSTTVDFTLDVVGPAVNKKLVGELVVVQFQQDGTQHYALGQITEIELRNVWHEDPTMRSVIRQRGSVNAVSERQDTHIGKMVLSAVFKEAPKIDYDQSILGTVPATGTKIYLVSDPILSEVLKPCKDSLFYFGHVYGSTPKLPLWFKHFGSGIKGNGEAYHLGIFGKSGSGKSVLARMCLAAYSAHREMAMIVIDPQGEFSKELRNTNMLPTAHPVPLAQIFKARGKKCVVFNLSNLVLDRWALFEQLLIQSKFFDRLTISSVPNREKAADVLAEGLKKGGITLEKLVDRTSFDTAWDKLSQDKTQKEIYASQESRDRLSAVVSSADKNEFYNDYWKPIANLFSKGSRPTARTVYDCLKWVLTGEKDNRPILVIDLSEKAVNGLEITDKIRYMLIKRLLEGITDTAEEHFKDDQSLNTLVMIDEAHRLAPRELPTDNEDAKGIRHVLIDSIRTTRKYGLGWMFISQTMSSIHMEILQQLRIYFIGFGLGLGQEFQSIQQIVGSKSSALDLYSTFRDPNSSFSTEGRQYPFMTIGPVSPLSFSGTPLFLNVFNSMDEFLKTNGITIDQQGLTPQPGA